MSFRSYSSDIKEGFVVSGSGTVLGEFAEEEFQDGKTHHPGAYSILSTLGLRDYFLSDNVNLEDLSLSQIDLLTIIEAFKYEGDPQHFDKEAYVTNVAEALGLDPIQLFQTFEELASAKQASAVTHVKDTAIALGVDKIDEDALGVDLTTMTKGVNQFSEVETFKKETFEKTVAEDGIGWTKIPQAFEEVVNTKKTRIEAITKDMAASLGVNLTTVTEALRKVTHEQGSIDKETLAKSLAVEMGFDSTTIFKALDRGIDVQDLDEDSFLRIINKTAGIEDSHDYNHVKNKVGGNFEDLEAVLASSTTSANVESFTRATLNSTNLKSLTVKDLPERIKEKMLSLLRSQREKSLRKRRLTREDNLGESHADKELRKGKINCGKFKASSTVLVEHNSVF